MRGRVQSESGSIRLELDPSAQVTAFGWLAPTEKLARHREGWGRARTPAALRPSKPGDLFPLEIVVLRDPTGEHPRPRDIMQRRRLSFAGTVPWLFDRKGTAKDCGEARLARSRTASA